MSKKDSLGDYISEASQIANSHKYQTYLKKLEEKSIASSINQNQEYFEDKIVIKKSTFRNVIIGFVITVCLSITAYNMVLKEPMERQKKLDAANDYMNTKIVTYLEDINMDYEVLEGKKIVIFEKDLDKFTKLCEIMQSDGFNRDEIFYVVSKTCNDYAFDTIVKTSGYENKEDFLNSNYFSGELSYTGKRYITKDPDYERFENNIEVNYVKNVERIQYEASKKANERSFNK